MSAVPIRIVPSPDAMFRLLDGEAVILDLASATYFGLNSVGARFWQLLTINSSYSAAIEALKAEYEVDEATLRQDLEALVSALQQAGLVRAEVESPASAS